MLSGYAVTYRMSVVELASGLGIGLKGGFIEIVDANGSPTGAMYLTGVVGAPPQQVAGSESRTRLAAQHINQWSAVYDVDGVHCNRADNTSITTSGTLVGVAANAADTGGAVQIVTNGDILGYAGLSVGPVFLGTSGGLVSTPPVSGVIVKIGYVPVSNILVVNVQQPIVIS